MTEIEGCRFCRGRGYQEDDDGTTPCLCRAGVPCAECEGSGMVPEIAADGRLYDLECPECDGFGRVRP